MSKTESEQIDYVVFKKVEGAQAFSIPTESNTPHTLELYRKSVAEKSGRLAEDGIFR